MPENRPAGYAFLIEKYQLTVIPNWHVSSVQQAGGLNSSEKDGRRETAFPAVYWPGDGIGDHLTFALKYDGLNPGILAALFEVVPSDEISDWVRSKPTGKYVRRIWYLYEFLTGQILDLPDLKDSSYVDLLETDQYYTATPGHRKRRQRVMDNLLGGPSFCPVIRKTPELAVLEQSDLRQRCEEIVTTYSPDLLRRALAYLYTKETKSSFEIEQIKPSATRTEKFIELLELAEHQDFCVKPLLIEAQNRIVDERFKDSDYRQTQNYVGQTIAPQKEIIHYICPKPDDLQKLMAGLIEAHQIMQAGGIPAVIHAAAIAYGFVFLHPFEDGNGRLHRFLIHNILSMRGAVPPGIMFPVSAAMLKNRALYEDSLRAFSIPLGRLVDYELNAVGQMNVTSDSERFYRFMDLTTQALALYEFVQLTINHELVEELAFLKNYDMTKRSLQEVVDMPDRLIDLFIHLCIQSRGHLSSRKKESHFDFLTRDEVDRMEAIVRAGYFAD